MLARCAGEQHARFSELGYARMVDGMSVNLGWRSLICLLSNGHGSGIFNSRVSPPRGFVP